MNVVTNATRKVRKAMQAGCRNGLYALRVCKVGNSYQLGAERRSSIVLFGKKFEKQGTAVGYGYQKCKQVAKRYMKAIAA